MTDLDKTALLERIVAIARDAGVVILPYYRADTAVDDKADGSPVTAADRAAEVVILAALQELTPDIPVVAE